MNTATGLTAFDSAVQVTNAWIKELAEDLGDPDDRYRAYHALRAVLHALRDRLTVEETSDLAAQLPMLVRGFYFEGWRPAGKPLRERTRQRFLSHIEAAFPDDIDTDPADVTRAVFKLLSRHVSPGEIADVKGNLPEEIRALWA
jgi:uncharacterized protein (DUF2267 family)